MKKRLFLSFMFFAILLVLVACGGQEEKSLLDQIKERGYITIATSGDNPPTIYPNEKNELIGLDADWAKEIADGLGVDIEWKRMDFPGIIPSITAKQVDIAMSCISVTDARMEVVEFTEYYAFEDVIAIFPEGTTDIKSPLDIKGKVVGVVSGSHNGEAPAREIGGFKDLITYPGIATVFEDLKTGRIEVAITGRVVGGYWLQNEGQGYKMSDEGYLGSKIAVVVNKDNPELRDAINEIIKKGKEEGKYKEYALKHIGTEFAQ